MPEEEAPAGRTRDGGPRPGWLVQLRLDGQMATHRKQAHAADPPRLHGPPIMEPGGLQGFSHGLGVNRRERDVRGGCPDHWHDNVVPCPAAHLTGHLAGERCKKERLAMLTKHAPCADIVDP